MQQAEKNRWGRENTALPTPTESLIDRPVLNMLAKLVVRLNKIKTFA